MLGLYVGGEWVVRTPAIELRNPFDDSLAGMVSTGTAADVRTAITRAAEALTEDLSAHALGSVLFRTAERVQAQAEEYAWDIAREGSKTIREARREASRSASILHLCAEEARRLRGETLPFDSREGSENRVGYYFRFPVGIVGAIASLNDPLAVAVHKVGPALAGGNSVVLKPSSLTPLSALRLARDFEEAGLPRGRLSVITGGDDIGEVLVTDPRVRMISFTGGLATGEQITRIAGVKKLSLELGANSPVIVLANADVERAVAAICSGAFAQAGQNCLGVQRVLIHEQIYDRFAAQLVRRVAGLRVGSTLDEQTDVCAMIHETQAERVETWVREAIAGGARVLIGGRREGALFWPAVVERVPEGGRLDREEIYGPVVSLYPVGSLDEAIERANSSRYGLHAAIFTESLRDAFTAVRRLDAGAVIVNDSTDYRLDAMPFGGVKSSGIGREGIRFAIEEMTETRVVCLNL